VKAGKKRFDAALVTAGLESAEPGTVVSPEACQKLVSELIQNGWAKDKSGAHSTQRACIYLFAYSTPVFTCLLFVYSAPVFPVWYRTPVFVF
jgi:hypothetical protein